MEIEKLKLKSVATKGQKNHTSATKILTRAITALRERKKTATLSRNIYLRVT